MKSRLRLLRWPAIFAASFVIGLALLPVLYYAASEANRPVCPKCGPGPHVVKWVYGYLILDSHNESPPGSVRERHGGCVVTDTSPRWRCTICGRDWGLYMKPEGDEWWIEHFPRKYSSDTD
jgi:hypothetical protein